MLRADEVTAEAFFALTNDRTTHPLLNRLADGPQQQAIATTLESTTSHSTDSKRRAIEDPFRSLSRLRTHAETSTSM